MATVSSAPVAIYANADPTAAYTFGTGIDMATAEYADVVVTASGTSPVSFQFKWQTADVLAGPYADEPVVESAGGVGTARALVVDLMDDDGTVLSAALVMRWYRSGRRFVRPAIKRTGGAGTDRIAMTATIAME
jgi:hypothetical protein